MLYLATGDPEFIYRVTLIGVMPIKPKGSPSPSEKRSGLDPQKDPRVEPRAMAKASASNCPTIATIAMSR